MLTLKQKLKTDRRFGSALKEDKLLSAIRQRFAIPGGACSFDLPNLHFWLQQPLEQRLAEIAQWLETLALLDMLGRCVFCRLAGYFSVFSGPFT